MFFSALIFVIYDPSLSGRYPNIFYLIAAVGIFAYQTLDNLDGQQARKIGACSPLGQLIDHGLDSFTASSFVIILLCCLGIEQGSALVWIFMIVNVIATFMANTEEYYTGVFNIQIDGFGVSEIQTGLIILCFICFFGNCEEKTVFACTVADLIGK